MDLLFAVKIIKNNTSKKIKGYAFIKYTTEEAGGAALKAMNVEVAGKSLFADRLYIRSIYLLDLHIYCYLFPLIL
jgi:RNA recognition motif-containing protein